MTNAPHDVDSALRDRPGESGKPEAASARPSALLGSPETGVAEVRLARFRNILLGEPHPLASEDYLPLGEPSLPPEPHQAPVVRVWESGRQFELPLLALSEGLSRLRLATEGHVPLSGYAEAVAVTLQVMARGSGLICLDELQSHGRDNPTNP